MAKPIIINEFQKGIGASPVVGFANMRNVNVSDRPGIVYPNKPLSLDSSTIITEKPVAMINFSGKAYALDANDTLWWRGGGGGSTWASRATTFA